MTWFKYLNFIETLLSIGDFKNFNIESKWLMNILI